MVREASRARSLFTSHSCVLARHQTCATRPLAQRSRSRSDLDFWAQAQITVKSMQARSAAGRAIVAEVETGVAPAKSYERTIKIRKATIETRIGVRFGLHPETKQVIITELYSGYPAHDCGNLFVGDVVTKINKVLVTDVDMASQLVKMTEGEVELKTENVYMSPHKVLPATRLARSRRPRPPRSGDSRRRRRPRSTSSAASTPHRRRRRRRRRQRHRSTSATSCSATTSSSSVPRRCPPPRRVRGAASELRRRRRLSRRRQRATAPPAGFAPPQQPAGFVPPLMPTTQWRRPSARPPRRRYSSRCRCSTRAPPPMGPPGTAWPARPAAPPATNGPWNKGANILNFSRG